jgi:hypothetical protein
MKWVGDVACPKYEKCVQSFSQKIEGKRALGRQALMGGQY